VAFVLITTLKEEKEVRNMDRERDRHVRINDQSEENKVEEKEEINIIVNEHINKECDVVVNQLLVDTELLSNQCSMIRRGREELGSHKLSKWRAV
jgi:hypothetical protein